MITPTPIVYSVSQLNARIANLIASDDELQMIFIEGELSNVNINSKSGHMYFSLKDKNSVIRAVMFSWAVRNLRFRPEDGMKVIMLAQVTVYEPSGQNQGYHGYHRPSFSVRRSGAGTCIGAGRRRSRTADPRDQSVFTE